MGSGALPVETLPSPGLGPAPVAPSERALDRLAAALRALPVPVFCRITQGALILDLRGLDDEDAVLSNLEAFG